MPPAPPPLPIEEDAGTLRTYGIDLINFTDTTLTQLFQNDPFLTFKESHNELRPIVAALLDATISLAPHAGLLHVYQGLIDALIAIATFVQPHHDEFALQIYESTADAFENAPGLLNLHHITDRITLYRLWMRASPQPVHIASRLIGQVENLLKIAERAEEEALIDELTVSLTQCRGVLIEGQLLAGESPGLSDIPSEIVIDAVTRFTKPALMKSLREGHGLAATDALRTAAHAAAVTETLHLKLDFLMCLAAAGLISDQAPQPPPPGTPTEEKPAKGKARKKQGKKAAPSATRKHAPAVVLNWSRLEHHHQLDFLQALSDIHNSQDNLASVDIIFRILSARDLANDEDEVLLFDFLPHFVKSQLTTLIFCDPHSDFDVFAYQQECEISELLVSSCIELTDRLPLITLTQKKSRPFNAVEIGSISLLDLSEYAYQAAIYLCQHGCFESALAIADSLCMIMQRYRDYDMHHAFIAEDYLACMRANNSETSQTVHSSLYIEWFLLKVRIQYCLHLRELNSKHRKRREQATAELTFQTTRTDIFGYQRPKTLPKKISQKFTPGFEEELLQQYDGDPYHRALLLLAFARVRGSDHSHMLLSAACKELRLADQDEEALCNTLTEDGAHIQIVGRSHEWIAFRLISVPDWIDSFTSVAQFGISVSSESHRLPGCGVLRKTSETVVLHVSPEEHASVSRRITIGAVLPDRTMLQHHPTTLVAPLPTILLRGLLMASCFEHKAYALALAVGQDFLPAYITEMPLRIPKSVAMSLLPCWKDLDQAAVIRKALAISLLTYSQSLQALSIDAHDAELIRRIDPAISEFCHQLPNLIRKRRLLVRMLGSHFSLLAAQQLFVCGAISETLAALTLYNDQFVTFQDEVRESDALSREVGALILILNALSTVSPLRHKQTSSIKLTKNQANAIAALYFQTVLRKPSNVSLPIEVNPQLDFSSSQKSLMLLAVGTMLYPSDFVFKSECLQTRPLRLICEGASNPQQLVTELQNFAGDIKTSNLLEADLLSQLHEWLALAVYCCDASLVRFSQTLYVMLHPEWVAPPVEHIETEKISIIAEACDNVLAIWRGMVKRTVDAMATLRVERKQKTREALDFRFAPKEEAVVEPVVEKKSSKSRKSKKKSSGQRTTSPQTSGDLSLESMLLSVEIPDDTAADTDLAHSLAHVISTKVIMTQFVFNRKLTIAKKRLASCIEQSTPLICRLQTIHALCIIGSQSVLSVLPRPSFGLSITEGPITTPTPSETSVGKGKKPKKGKEARTKGDKDKEKDIPKASGAVSAVTRLCSVGTMLCRSGLYSIAGGLLETIKHILQLLPEVNQEEILKPLILFLFSLSETTQLQEEGAITIRTILMVLFSYFLDTRNANLLTKGIALIQAWVPKLPFADATLLIPIWRQMLELCEICGDNIDIDSLYAQAEPFLELEASVAGTDSLRRLQLRQTLARTEPGDDKTLIHVAAGLSNLLDRALTGKNLLAKISLCYEIADAFSRGSSEAMKCQSLEKRHELLDFYFQTPNALDNSHILSLKPLRQRLLQFAGSGLEAMGEIDPIRQQGLSEEFQMLWIVLVTLSSIGTDDPSMSEVCALVASRLAGAFVTPLSCVSYPNSNQLGRLMDLGGTRGIDSDVLVALNPFPNPFIPSPSVVCLALTRLILFWHDRSELAVAIGPHMLSLSLLHIFLTSHFLPVPRERELARLLHSRSLVKVGAPLRAANLFLQLFEKPGHSFNPHKPLDQQIDLVSKLFELNIQDSGVVQSALYRVVHAEICVVIATLPTSDLSWRHTARSLVSQLPTDIGFFKHARQLLLIKLAEMDTPSASIMDYIQQQLGIVISTKREIPMETTTSATTSRKKKGKTKKGAQPVIETSQPFPEGLTIVPETEEDKVLLIRLVATPIATHTLLVKLVQHLTWTGQNAELVYHDIALTLHPGLARCRLSLYAIASALREFDVVGAQKLLNEAEPLSARLGGFCAFQHDLLKAETIAFSDEKAELYTHAISLCLHALKFCGSALNEHPEKLDATVEPRFNSWTRLLVLALKKASRAGCISVVRQMCPVALILEGMCATLEPSERATLDTVASATGLAEIAATAVQRFIATSGVLTPDLISALHTILGIHCKNDDQEAMIRPLLVLSRVESVWRSIATHGDTDVTGNLPQWLSLPMLRPTLSDICLTMDLIKRTTRVMPEPAPHCCMYETLHTALSGVSLYGDACDQLFSSPPNGTILSGFINTDKCTFVLAIRDNVWRVFTGQVKMSDARFWRRAISQRDPDAPSKLLHTLLGIEDELDFSHKEEILYSLTDESAGLIIDIDAAKLLSQHIWERNETSAD